MIISMRRAVRVRRFTHHPAAKLRPPASARLACPSPARGLASLAALTPSGLAISSQDFHVAAVAAGLDRFKICRRMAPLEESRPSEPLPGATRHRPLAFP